MSTTSAIALCRGATPILSCSIPTLPAGDLADDKFALFVAGEPHMPTLEFPGDGAQPVKKICFKLLADAYWEE